MESAAKSGWPFAAMVSLHQPSSGKPETKINSRARGKRHSRKQQNQQEESKILKEMQLSTTQIFWTNEQVSKPYKQITLSFCVCNVCL